MKKILLVVIILVIAFFLFFNKKDVVESVKMADLSNMTITEIQEYAKENKLELTIKDEYDFDIAKDTVISQSIKKDTIIKANNALVVVISKGPTPLSVYQDNKVNELGNIPVMMYHGIRNRKENETVYTGGNIDKDGYNRTIEAFKNDLEMYYQNDYRMIRLIDYMNGNIDVELGKSPIVLTFDDGNANNFNVLGIDEKGNLEIDPNCAVGILEEFRQKYKDFNVTATFFLNKGLFGQPQYNEKILKWLVDNGYDIGNHTKNHVDFSKADSKTSQSEIAYMYKLFDEIIPEKYVHVIALPYGSPGSKSHANFPFILSGTSDDYEYETEGTLRVGWDANYSPFHKKFDKTFMMRVRAWDDNGEDFDIQRVFDNLKTTRYVSDGNNKTIVIKSDINLNNNLKDKKIIKY